MTQKIYTIAKILHLAADKFLCSSGHVSILEKGVCSCMAINHAVYYLYGYEKNNKNIRLFTINRINKGMMALGLDTRSMNQFEEFSKGRERQQVRYAWLKFVALLAEEQGV